jgi:hypothetical protein
MLSHVEIRRRSVQPSGSRFGVSGCRARHHSPRTRRPDARHSYPRLLPKKLSDSGAAKLLSRRGPFSSLLAKTAFASELGLIGDETRKDLEGINAVRNAFAHPKGFLRFASPEVVAVFKKHWPEADGAQALLDDRIQRAAEAMKAKFDSLIYESSVRP